MSWLGTYGFEVSLGNLGGHPAGRRVYPPHCRKRSVLQICVRVISVEVGGGGVMGGVSGERPPARPVETEQPKLSNADENLKNETTPAVD